MSTLELFEFLQAWLWKFEHTPFQRSNDPKVVKFSESVENKWKEEMLMEIARLKIPIDLDEPRIRHALQAAICYANDIDLLEARKVYVLINNIQTLLMTEMQRKNLFSSN